MFGWVCEDMDDTLKPVMKSTSTTSAARRDYFEPFNRGAGYGQVNSASALRQMYAAFKTEGK